MSRAVTKETAEQKEQRLDQSRSKREDRADKLAIREKDEKEHLIRITNIFTQFDIPYLQLKKAGQDPFKALQSNWHGRQFYQNEISLEAWNFLKENFKFNLRLDDYGRTRIHFFPHESVAFDERLDRLGSLLHRLVVRSQQPASSVRAVYDGLIEECRSSLAKKRRFRLPGLGYCSVRYRPAQATREGHNPKTGEVIQIPGQPEHNYLRFSPSRRLRDWVAENVPVAKPKKHKVKAEKKRRRRKKYRSVHEEQTEFHIT